MPEKKTEEVPEIEQAEEKEAKELPIVVVKELPSQQVDVGTITETGEQVKLITIEEALTKLLENSEKIVKGVA